MSVRLPDSLAHEWPMEELAAPDDAQFRDNVGAAHLALPAGWTFLAGGGVKSDELESAEIPFSTSGLSWAAAALVRPVQASTRIDLHQTNADPHVVFHADRITFSTPAGDDVDVFSNDVDLSRLYFVALQVAEASGSGRVLAVDTSTGKYEHQTFAGATTAAGVDAFTMVATGADVEFHYGGIVDGSASHADLLAWYRNVRLRVLGRGGPSTLEQLGADTRPAATLGVEHVRRALRDMIARILQTQDPNFNIEERLRSPLVTLDEATEKSRRSIMGDPIRYCAVFHTADDDDDDLVSGGGAPLNRSYRFTVSLWYGYADADTYDLSSQSGFDEAIDDPESGLLQVLQRQTILDVGGDVTTGPPYEIGQGEIALLRDPERVLVDYWTDAHYLSFEITATLQMA